MAQFKCELEIDSVIRTAEAAGAAVMQIYKEESKWEVEIKADHSPLTRADREANHIICEDLLRMTPHVPIVSEENKKLPYEYRNNFQYFWLIDPLDGTKEFLKRNGEFTVNIALIQGGVPVLGVVHVPVTGKTYWAVKGKGAWLKEGDSQKRIKCAEFNLDDPGLTIVASSSHGSKETNEFISVFDK